MPSRIKDYLILMAAGLSLSTSVPAAHTSSESLTLLSRSSAAHLEVQLDQSQRQWIKNKRELILGTSAPDYPPFDLTVSGHEYEGYTADYAGILGESTGLAIKVQRFESRGRRSWHLKTARWTCSVPPTGSKLTMPWISYCPNPTPSINRCW